MFLHYAPYLLKKFFHRYVWHLPTDKKTIYLTFDDGPIPDITEFVLDTLRDYQAKATFFCIGDNVRKHPDIFNKVIADGHSIGNHTFNHLNGWNSENQHYLDNIDACDQILSFRTNLFRPPYGRIKKAQALQIPTDRKIVMWDVLSGDFSLKLSPETCLAKSIQYSRPGSIVLFHDSIKASKNMSYTLPRYLEHFSKLDYNFKAIPMQSLSSAV
jgi:peptidoglycan/xylan/chitin deacetylase (PgdA/CDA1 family)